MKFDFIPDDVSKFDNAYDVLKERGFIEQSTDEDKIRELLRNEKVKFYIGFDPTIRNTPPEAFRPSRDKTR